MLLFNYLKYVMQEQKHGFIEKIIMYLNFFFLVIDKFLKILWKKKVHYQLFLQNAELTWSEKKKKIDIKSGKA